MCKHERIAKIDKIYRCRDCGQLFDEMPKPVKADSEEPKKAVKKAPAKKGVK